MMTIVTQASSPNMSPRIGKPAYIAIHRMEGYFDYTVNEEFPSAASEVCADRCMSKDGHRVAVFNHASSGLKTWAVGNANSLSMSIETEGFAGDEATLTAAFFDTLASQCLTLQHEIAAKYGVVIPLTHSQTKGVPGIVGHHQLGLWYGGSDHTCPGPDFPWDRLMAAVKAMETQRQPYLAEVIANGKVRKRVRYGEGRVKALFDSHTLSKLLKRYGNVRVKRVKAG